MAAPDGGALVALLLLQLRALIGVTDAGNESTVGKNEVVPPWVMNSARPMVFSRLELARRPL